MVDSNQLKKYAKKHFTFTGKKKMNRIPSTDNIWITQNKSTKSKNVHQGKMIIMTKFMFY